MCVRCIPVEHYHYRFYRPKAGREVGALNWTQEPKSVWDGPTLKATSHAPPPASARLARAEVGQRAGVRANSDRRPLLSTALVARADFLKIGHFAPFSHFLHINCRNFPDVFIRSRLPMIPVNREKFHGNRSARFWEIRKTDRQTDGRGNFIYID